MTTTAPVRGDIAAPVSIQSGGQVAGTPVAINVYGFNTPEEAIAAGFSIEAGPAMPIYLVSQAELDNGTYVAEGDPYATPVYTAPGGMVTAGLPAIPVVVVNDWPLPDNALLFEDGSYRLTEAGEYLVQES